MANPLSKILGPLSGLLNLGGGTIVGLDIGLSAIKIAEVDCDHKNNSFTLLKYASVPLPEGAIIEDEIQKKEEIVEAIKEAVDASGVSGNMCCLGIGGPNTVARKLQVAGGTEDEIEDQVVWESEQYLPFDIEDSTVSYHLIGENEGGGVDVIVGAARNDVIANFKELAEEAGLKPKIVDLNILSLVNVFDACYGESLGDPLESHLLLDLGAQTSSFVIYKNGMVLFTKEINVGGVMITEEIQRQMGVNYFEAEDLKITGDENGNLPEEILEIIDDVVEAFFAEIKKTIDFYVSSTSDESLTTCFVTGGSALIPGILEGLEALLGVQVNFMNPFEHFDYDQKKFSEEEINEVAYKGAVVLGLGMRKF